MFKNNHPAYFYTSDKVRIFYNTNFRPEDFDPKGDMYTEDMLPWVKKGELKYPTWKEYLNF